MSFLARRTLLAVPRIAAVRPLGGIAARKFTTSRMQLEVIKRYTKEHEWVSLDTDTGVATFGISDYAQNSLGEIVYVELPEVDAELDAGDQAGTVESVKSASDLYIPVGGVVQEVNEKLSDTPGLINKSPEEEGWIAKVKVEEGSVDIMKELFDAEAYDALTKQE